MAKKPKDENPKDEKPGAKGDPSKDYSELVLVVHAANLAEAELYRAELEAHGIPAVLEQEGAGVAGIPDVGGGVPVLVPEGFADEAAEFIAEIESTKSEDHTVAENEDDILNEDEDTEDLDEELDEDEDLEDEDLDDDEDWDEDEDEDLDEDKE